MRRLARISLAGFLTLTLSLSGTLSVFALRQFNAGSEEAPAHRELRERFNVQLLPQASGLEEIKALEEISPDPERWGKKGSRLAQMKQAGLPIPNGFVVGIGAFQKLHAQQIPWVQMKGQLFALEQKTVRRFGDSQQPLFLAVRSGAAEALPGLMATLIGVGLNDETVKGLAQEIGEVAAYDAYARFLWHYAVEITGVDNRLIRPQRQQTLKTLQTLIEEYKLAIDKKGGERFPQDPWKQLEGALRAVATSWDRADVQTYIDNLGLQLNGTAIVVQEAVFGTSSAPISGAGVFHTRDPQTGQGRSGWFLTNAQGEDLMTRGVTWSPSQDAFRDLLRRRQEDLNSLGDVLESIFHTPQSVEFVVDHDGRFHLVQSDDTIMGPLARLTALRALREKGILTEPDYISQLATIPVTRKAVTGYGIWESLASGHPIGEGVARGTLMFITDSKRLEEGAQSAIVVVDQIDEFIRRAILRKSINGLILTGSKISLHDESLLRTRGLLTLVGAQFKQVVLEEALKAHQHIDVILEVGFDQGVLVKDQKIDEVPLLGEGLPSKDYVLVRKQGKESKTYGQMLLAFDYDAGIVEETWVHFNAPPVYIGKRPIGPSELYEYLPVGFHTTVIPPSSANPFAQPTSSKFWLDEHHEVFVVDPLNVFYLTERTGALAASLIQGALIDPERLPGLQPEDIRVLPLVVNQEPVSYSIVVKADGEILPQEKLWKQNHVAVITLNPQTTLAQFVQEVLAQWTGRPVGEVLQIEHENGRLRIYA